MTTTGTDQKGGKFGTKPFQPLPYASRMTFGSRTAARPTSRIPVTETKASSTGGYAVTTVKSMSWLSTPVKNTAGKGQKPKAQPVILHPFFAECAETCEDSYWKTVLTSCSLGKFPRGFTFRNMYLTQRRGTRSSRIQLPSDPALAAKTAVGFFQDQTGMRSQIDCEREQRELTEECTEEISYEQRTWSELSRKLRGQMIDNFVCTIATDMGLTPHQKRKLMTLINLGFIMGHFTADHVSYSGGTINSISGLAYNPETREFIFDPTKINTKPTSKTKNKIIPPEVYLDPHYRPHIQRRTYVMFFNLWVSFINSLTRTAPVSSKVPPTSENETEETQELLG